MLRAGPGRLELHVEIGLPDEKGRLQILDIKTASMSLDSNLAFDMLRAACAEHFRQIGPKSLKYEKETTHFHHSWRRRV